MKNKILGWVLFLPAAVVASFAIFAASKLGSIMALSQFIYPRPSFTEFSWLTFMFADMPANFLSGASFVYAGVSVAPEHKKSVAALLFGMIIICYLMSICYTVSFGTGQTQPIAATVLGIVAAAGGSGFAAWKLQYEKID